MRSVLLAETRDVPHADGQVHGSRNNEILFWVELRTPVSFEQAVLKDIKQTRRDRTFRTQMS